MSPRDSLDDLLDRWQLPPAGVPDLRGAIRTAIAATPTATRPPWWRSLEAAFARPSFAAAFIAACVLLGLFLAEARVARLHAEHGAEIARSYLQLIDPLLDAAPHATAAGKAVR